MLYNFQAENARAIIKLKELKVELRDFPVDVIEAAKKGLAEVVSSLSQQNTDFAEVYKSAFDFLKASKSYTDISLKNYLNIR